MRARQELEFWVKNIEDMAGHPKPMWRVSPQERLRRFKNGERVAYTTLSTDASWMGWGAILELIDENGKRESLETSARWRSEDKDTEQAHREAQGALNAFKTFRRQLQGKTVLHLTDCMPVAEAVGKGSKNSIVLQDIAVELFQLAASWAIHVESAWIKGDEMVLCGSDRLSREDTIDRHDVRVTAETWRMALQMAERAGMQLTVDLFADADNSMLERFWTR